MRLARGMAWSTVGAVSSRALALLASIIAARILGKSVFGELGIIQSTTNMYRTFGQLGGLTATKHVAEFRKKDPERAGRMIALSIIVAVTSGSVVGMLMVATAPWAARLLAAPDLQGAIALSALALLLIVINETLDGILSGFEAFKRRSIRPIHRRHRQLSDRGTRRLLLWTDRRRLGVDRFAGFTGFDELPGDQTRGFSSRRPHSVARSRERNRDSSDLQPADALFRSSVMFQRCGLPT